MSNSKNNSKNNNKNNSIDLSQIELPTNESISNKILIETIIEMNIERAKNTPKFPLVGVNEIANFLNETHNLEIDGKYIRRKLQKIRKNKEYKSGKIGETILKITNNKNPFNDKQLFIKWANLNNKEKGIYYLISPIEMQ